MDKNKINIKSIQKNVKNGKIIEYYYDDYPYQSCLILGKDCNNEVLHIVCGVNGSIVYVITAYYPDSIKWE